MEAFPSPRPTPKFYPEPQTFSTKKVVKNSEMPFSVLVIFVCCVIEKKNYVSPNFLAMALKCTIDMIEY